jgi:hypothetical protein
MPNLQRNAGMQKHIAAAQLTKLTPILNCFLQRQRKMTFGCSMKELKVDRTQ